MATITITDAQLALLLALAQQLDPPRTVDQFVELVSRATLESCP